MMVDLDQHDAALGSRLRELRALLSDGARFRDGAAALAESVAAPEVAEALRRLALLHEIAECLEAAGEVVAFVDRALEGLAQSLESGVAARDEAARILVESSERWGDYIALLEAGESEEDLPEVVDEPAIDAGELLRRIAGGRGPADGPPSVPADQVEELERDSDGRERMLDVNAPPPTPSSQGGEPESAPPVDKGGAGGGRSAILSSAPFLAKGGLGGTSVNVDLDPELREVFLADATDLFDRIQSLVLNIGERHPSADGLRELGRCLHTLKGAAGSVGLTDLAARIHELEDRLEAADGLVSAALMGALEMALRSLECTLAGLRGSPQPVEAAQEDSPHPPSAADGPIRVSADRLDELMDVASELLARRGFWKAQANAMTQCAATTRACGLRLRASADRLRRLRPEVSVELEEILRGLEEQAEDLTVVAESARAAAVPLADEGEALARASLQLWEILQSVRIAPVRGLFHRLARVAHEAARVEGRSIEVVLCGEENGLDRSVQERAFEPLLHVVRNAVGHGLEPSDARRQAGKPDRGRVALEARREGNALVLAVEDDGRGLDYAAIEAKGRALGLLAPDEAPNVTRLNALIFQPGFSTRTQANAIAGRGVGMDVVAQEVARLRGTLELTSRPGLGTRLTVRLPARLALEQVMVVRVAGQLFALPLAAVESVESAEETPIGTLLDAREALGLGGAVLDAGAKLLIVRADGQRWALKVDGVEGVRELVVKPLGPLLEGHPTLSGTSLTTAGEVILFLNPGALVQAQPWGEAKVASKVVAPGNAALVVDDSLSVRRVAVRNLRGLGLEVDEVGDGLEALGRLRRKSYRLVLTDLEMPRMDGFELLGELARTGLLGSTPLVVCSTRSDPETRRRALSLGARAFLPKPVDADALAHVVAPLL